MTKTAIRVQVETPTLDLDARLALAQLAMDAKLNEAAVRFEVNTAHIESALVVDFAPAILPAPGLTPLADLLHRAHARIQRDGWTTGHCRDEQGATCLYGAIRTEAATPGQAADACAVLLDTIRAQFPDTLTVPAWNDEQHDPAVVLRMLNQAAHDAATRGI
ncbi:DUF6197 family protein [Streptomyces formicae]|uniref:DUF6197 family protein n=1 Tax=Streptomyces formicae TaxID=1616117 RepID=UPI00361A51A8